MQAESVRAKENRPPPYNRPEVGVGPARASDVTPHATSFREYGGSEPCPLADPGEAWGQVGLGAGVGAAGAYQAPCSIRGVGPTYLTSGVYVSVAGAGRRPEFRVMEEPVYLCRGARRLSKPGKGKCGSGLSTLLSPRPPFPGPVPPPQLEL